MKKIIYYSLILLGLAGCKKSNIAADQRPDERLTDAIAVYQKQLVASENGWIGYLFPKGGGSYTFKFKFDDKNRVITYSDIDKDKATTGKESSYRIKGTQLPALYFDTYSYLHLLADPDPKSAGGAEGKGFVSDFEFSFLASGADTIKLQGNLNGSNMILVRAKATEGDDYIDKAFTNNNYLATIANFKYYYNKLSIAGKEYNVSLNSDKHTISFYYDQSGFKSFTTEYGITANGLILRVPFVDGTTVVSELSGFNIDVAAGTAEFTAAGTKLTMTNGAIPLIIDKGAPTRMFVTKQHTWVSKNGFTLAGVKDAHGVKSINGFTEIQYIPNWFNDPFDIAWFKYNGGNRYGPIFNTRLDPDGKMVFVKSPYGNQANPSGNNPGAAGVAIVNKFYNQFTEVGGYYAFETGKNTFDLVSVTDSKNWIRFQ
ncbi:DUF4302 domain-containing protein [Pedobacter caeni]|uniref:DUF4302 domain-containing protein n=1 Tax=Pedobacter caeni TaxID=288992 RepID=A0A1M5HJ59_9SPHI|nr:DUF4302 domain-containing protein [Pedobacter caeni]SHG15975.1 protein of unknown function [Pedobacter caeni]